VDAAATAGIIITLQPLTRRGTRPKSRGLYRIAARPAPGTVPLRRFRKAPRRSRRARDPASSCFSTGTGTADSTCAISLNLSPDLREQFNLALNLQVTPDFSPHLNSDFTAEFSLALNSEVTIGFKPALRGEFSLQFILGLMAELNPHLVSEVTAEFSPVVTLRFTAKFSPRFTPGFNPGVTLHFLPQVLHLPL